MNDEYSRRGREGEGGGCDFSYLKYIVITITKNWPIMATFSKLTKLLLVNYLVN